VLVGHVAVAVGHLVDGQVGDQPAGVGMRVDRDAVGITGAGQGRRIHTTCGERDLGGDEGDDLVARAVPVDDVEVVKAAARGSHDQDAPGHGFPAPSADLAHQPGTGRAGRSGVFLSREPGP
jgi:hypothetical protein